MALGGAGRTTLVAASVATALTVAVVGVPSARLAYANPTLHVALETAEGVIAALLAYLAVGRLRETRQLRDLALASAFTVFAVTNLLLSAVPVAALQERPVGFFTWAGLNLRLLATLVFVAAAVAPRRPLVLDRRLAVRLAAGSLAVVGGVLLLAAVADGRLSPGIDPGISPDSSDRPVVVGHPIVLGNQLVGALLLAAAAVAFTRRADRTGDDLLRWLGAGSAVHALARINYLMFPSLYTQWVYTGDALRVAAYLLYLVGAGRELTAYWRDRAEMAIAEERRRLARDLHDGLAQELSFIRSQLAGSTSGGLPPPMLRHVADAADRALRESRRVVEALAAPHDEDLASALRATVGPVAERAGVALEVDVTLGADVHPPAREHLLRIAREAVTNAARHGAARHVAVAVAPRDEGAAMVVVDDGGGFDVDAADHGFGLTSMSERARALGGDLRVSSRPGHGTTVEVWW